MIELGQNWIALRRALFPKRKEKGLGSSKHAIVVHHSGTALRVLSDVDALGTSTGQPVSEVASRVPGDRVLATFEAADLDRAIQASLAEGGVHHQIEAVRKTLKPTAGPLPPVEANFLIEAVTRTWWGKVLPSQFGVYLRFEGRKDESAHSPSSILVLFKRGRVEQFDEPDLSTLSTERQSDPNEVLKYLREKYGAPIQGIELHFADWLEWCESGDAPWKAIAKAIRVGRVSFVPLRMGVGALVGARAHLGI